MALFGRRRAATPVELDALLREALQQLAEGRTGSARRTFRNVVDDAAVMAPQHRAWVAPMQGTALVHLGDIALAAGGRGDAVTAYRAASALVRLPPPATRVLAEDTVRRGDLSAEGVRHMAAYIAADAAPQQADPLVAHITRLAWPPVGSPDHAVQVAEALSATVLAANPGAEWAHLARSGALVMLRRTDDAILQLHEAERTVPDSAAVAHRLGMLLGAADDLDGALIRLRRSLVLAPGNVEPAVEIARLCLAADRHLDEAAERIEQASHLAPNRADVWHLLGLVLGRRDPAAARAPLSRATRLAPHDVRYHRDRAAVMERLGDVGEVIVSLRAAHGLDPRDPDVATRLAILLAGAGEAEQLLREVVRADPGRRPARLELARILVGSDRSGEAVGLLAAIVDRTAQEGHLLGRAYARSGALDAAVTALERCLPLGSEPGIAFTLGCVRARRGEWTSAVAAFDLVPASYAAGIPDIDLLVGVACHHAGERTRARLCLEAAREASPDDPRPHCALGALAVDVGDHEGAAEAYRSALAVAPGHPDACFGLGRVLELLGQPDAAAEQYTRGLDSRPGWRPAVVRLAAIALGAGRPADAMALLADHASARDPAVDAVRALALARSGDHAAAVAIWTALRGAGDPDGAIATNIRLSRDHQATAALAAGDAGTARRLWEQCSEQSPTDDRYKSAILEACLRQAATSLAHFGANGRSGGPFEARVGSEVRSALGRAGELAPDEPRVGYLRGVVALSGSDPDPGLAEQLLLPLAPNDDHALYHLALALAMAGRTDRARDRLAAPGRGWSGLGLHRGLLLAALDAREGRYADALDGYRAALPAPGGPVPASVFAGIVRCAKELDVLPEAIEALTPYLAGYPPARRVVGSAHAELGDPAAALALLEPLLADGPDDALRAAVVGAHLARAVDCASRGDAAAAGRAVSAAAAVDPASPAVGAIRPLAAAWRAAALAEAGDAAGALRVWDARLRYDPTDLVAVRHTAVLSHSLLGDAGSTAVGGLVPLAVMAWTVVLASPAAWDALAERTGRPIDAEDRAAARRRRSEELVGLLRDHAGRSGVPVTAYDVEWGFELRVADAIAAFDPAARGVPGWPQGFAGGPAALERMASCSHGPARAVDALRAAAAAAPGDRRLATLLGPLGRCHHLVEDGRLDEAIAELDRMRASPATAELLARALLARGVERAKDAQWADAVGSFVRAAAEGADVARHAGPLVEAVRRRVAELRDQDEDAVRAVVAVMESVHPLIPRDPAFDADLAASYAELGKEVNNSDDYEQAVILLRKSLRLVPGDPNTRRFARIGMANLAYQLLAEGPPAVMGRAFGLFDESLAHTDADLIEQERAQIADLMFGQAKKRADGGDRATAITILRAAQRHVDDDITRRFIAALETGGQLP